MVRSSSVVNGKKFLLASAQYSLNWSRIQVSGSRFFTSVAPDSSGEGGVSEPFASESEYSSEE